MTLYIARLNLSLSLTAFQLKNDSKLKRRQ